MGPERIPKQLMSNTPPEKLPFMPEVKLKGLT
jgi:hypothetical protein